MTNYLNIMFLGIAMIWGGLKQDLFSNIYIDIGISIIVLISLWCAIESTTNDSRNKNE